MRQASDRDLKTHVKKMLTTCLARAALCSLLCGASTVAIAAAPLTLSDQQLDRVSAGLQQSFSSAFAYALSGFAVTVSQTSALGTDFFRWTDSTSAGIAAGFGVGATATAGTVFH